MSNPRNVFSFHRYGYDLDSCQGGDDLSCVNLSATPINCDKGYYYEDELFNETVITEVSALFHSAMFLDLCTSF